VRQIEDHCGWHSFAKSVQTTNGIRDNLDRVSFRREESLQNLTQRNIVLDNQNLFD